MADINWENGAITAPQANGIDWEAGEFVAPPKRTVAGTVKDIGVTALKGAVGLPQAAVGLLDIPTGGHAGKALEGAGLRFKDAQDALDTMYSPAQQAANRKVQEAEGFVGTAKAMLENPSTIATGIGESLPQMLGGAGVARGLMSAAPRLGAVAAGAIGEGVVGAGSAAEQIRQQTADGLLTGKQAALVGASGLATAGLGALGGKVAQRMGVGDVDTMLAGGTARAAGQGSTRSTVRQVLEGAVAEGALEEMPQSMAEQALQNVALERPWDQGVGAAAAQGLITGAAMGGVSGGVGASANRAHQRAEAQALQADPTRAWNTEAGATDPNQPATERAAPPEAPELQTSPGAAGPREGMDFTREVDTAGLALEDPAEVARARAATMEFQPTDATPQWETARGAAQDGQPGLDMPAPEFDTGSLGLESRSRSLTPSQQMGIDPGAGPLSKVAAAAVDASSSQEAQFLGATGRNLQVRRTGPGVSDESNVIDVQGRVVEDRAIGTPRRIEARQRLGTTESAPLSAAVAQPQSIPNAAANYGAANATPALSMQALAAMNNVANESPNLPNGVPNGRQATQAQQTAQEPAQAGAAPRAASERAPLEGSPGAAGQVGKVSPGVDAFEPAESRQEGWRKSMLKAGPAAKAMGIDPRGKRLAQVVAEIDAADAQRAGVRQDGADLAAGQIDHEWSAFAPETGTLGVPRAEMPQIKAEHRGALVNFLKARGIDSRADEVPANDLKPTQAEFSPAKVKKARAFQGGDRSILVSSDGYVVDGHHQWLAKRANGEPVKVIRLQAPIRQVLAQTAEFPSTASARGAQFKQGGTDAATPRDLRLADERAPGAAAPASDRAGPTAGSAAPAVGAGQREGGDTAQPAPAVRAAVPDAGGASQQGSGVAQQDRPPKWRGNMIAAAQVARGLGIDAKKYRKTADLVRAIDEADGKVEKPKPEPQTAKGDEPMSVGTAPGSSEPVTVRDGVVYLGKYEALNYDTGEPVTVPKGSTREDVHKALRDAGALTKNDKAFGLRGREAALMFSRTPATKTAYEARIDALFAGEKAKLQGARVLDRSDMLAFLGFGDGPVNLSEGKVIVGQDNHPHMTAAVWKKIPEWLENPALVFDSDTTQGRLVFIAPEMVNGSPVRIIVEPNAAGGVKAHLLVNAYDAQGGSFRRWESDGMLRYVDRNKYAHVSGSFQPRLAGLPGGRGRSIILTDKQYNGWRRANNAAYSQEMSPELARALLAIHRPATKDSVRAAVRQLVNGMGMLPNGLGRVVVATAAEIQQDWEPLIGPIQLNSEEQGQEGGAGKAQGFYDPNSRTVFVIADHIRQGDELGVVAHELMHKHGQAVLGEEGWNRLHGAIEGWAGAPEGSQERQVYDEAAARVRNSRPKNAAEQEYSSQELFPYAVQVALEQGVRPNLLAKQGTVARWLGQVKAALREVWTKIVGKPESFNLQDLVNLAFGIAQRENPAHSVELDGAVANAPEDRVGSTLLELGRDERLYQYPRSDSTDLVQIGAAKDLIVGPVDRNARESEVWMLANTTPADGDGVKSWMVRLPNGRPATITDNKGQVYINVSAVGEGGGGSRVYDLAANYALNNGAVFVGDPNGVSASAMRRRLENMLSSAIKYGTTDHLAPHPDQVTGRDGVAPLEWTPGDTLSNIESMVKASVAATEATNPLATSYVRYEPQTRSFDIDPDYGGRSGQVAQDLSDLLDFDGRKVGLGQGGRRTVQRTVFLRALLSGVGERRRVLERFRNEPTRGSQGSAAPEEGTTDRRIFYSRSVAAAPVTGDYTPAQQRAAEHAFGVQKQQTLAERAQAFRANLGTKLRQGLVDQFAPLKEVSDKAYMLARMSKGSDGAVEAALLYGKVFLRDGVYDVDVKDGGFAQVLASLKGEHDRFFQWVAAQRAERLKAEGKENLLTDQDITALGTLNAGKMADGAARMPVYAAALRELNAFNESALKVAMESGLIDQAAFDLMKDQPYVPFYRLMEEDGGMRGPRFSSGLVNQQAWKKLKGGTQQLNADLLQNTLLNWSHLYGAAARNRASLETMAAADKMGIAYQVPADTKGAVKVMRDGVAEHWAVEDPYLLDAISAMSYAPGGIVKAMAPFKRLLTFGVTVNPTFKIRNLIRDSLSAIAQSDLSYNPLENVAKGWTATRKESQTYASMLASGGIIKFGTQEDSGRVRTLIEKLGGQVLDQDGWGKLKSQMRSLWETYEEFGDRTENVNRAALYERLVAKGHSHAEASFMARDLMDFSMSGKWEVVRFLTQTVPFLNARMQGLYKLGRAAKADPRRFAAMAGAVSLASLGLLAAYGDDDDWKKREDWDRDNYWWFKIGDMAFRIPKPFEVGAIGTLAERTAELMMSEEMTGKRFGQRISDMVFNTFAMDPTPQFIKPFIDVYANKDSFSGRPIEGMADERLRPQDRYSERTSEVARLLGSWGLPDPLRLAKGEYSSLSPKQIDFLLRGYFGWLATVSTTVTDAAVRPALDRGERPAMRMRDTFLAGNFVESLPTGSSRYVSAMYEQARDVERAWASYQAAVKSGDMEKAREIQQDEAPKLRNRMAVENAKRQIAELGQQAKRIESSRLMPAEEKRRRLDEIEARKHEAARRVASMS